jgi:hypothetical protein
LSSVTFMPLRCVTEYAMYTGRCAGWLCHVGLQVYSNISEGHAFCIFRVTELDLYGVKCLGRRNKLIVREGCARLVGHTLVILKMQEAWSSKTLEQTYQPLWHNNLIWVTQPCTWVDPPCNYQVNPPPSPPFSDVYLDKFVTYNQVNVLYSLVVWVYVWFCFSYKFLGPSKIAA